MSRRIPVNGLARCGLAAIAIVGLAVAAVAAERTVAVPTLAVSAAPPLPESFRRLVPDSVEELRAIQKRVRLLNEGLQKATVGIRRGPAQGTGVIISEEGHVLTAAHVSGRPGSRVTLLLSDGTRVEGRSLGRQTEIDAGLVKITDSGTWPAARIGSAGDVKAGDWVIGIGHPGGFRAGRPGVPRLGRILSVQNWVLRTDVALIGGDSGGPLFDLHGRVVAIHSRIGADPNLNFHVPINVYRERWHWLLAGEQRPVVARVGGPLFGVNGRSEDGGCRVSRVFEDLPAGDAGIRKGDLILRIDDRFILGIEDLVASVNHYEPGDIVHVFLVRGGEHLDLPVRLGERPAREAKSEQSEQND